MRCLPGLKCASVDVALAYKVADPPRDEGKQDEGASQEEHLGTGVEGVVMLLLGGGEEEALTVRPNVRVNRRAEAGRLGPVGENVPSTADRAKVACRSASG